jgi:hypothetical protein
MLTEPMAVEEHLGAAVRSVELQIDLFSRPCRRHLETPAIPTVSLEKATGVPILGVPGMRKRDRLPGRIVKRCDRRSGSGALMESPTIRQRQLSPRTGLSFSGGVGRRAPRQREQQTEHDHRQMIVHKKKIGHRWPGPTPAARLLELQQMMRTG